MTDPVSLDTTALRLLRRFWYAVPILALFIAWRVTVGTLAERDAQLERAVATMRINAERIRAATESFRAAHSARVLRIERDQDRITQESDRDYQNRIDDLRRRVAALQLRASAATDPGGAGRAGGPAPLPDAAGEPDAAAAQGGLPSEDAVIATEQAIQLEELQRWIRRQLAVDRGAGGGAGGGAPPSQ